MSWNELTISWNQVTFLWNEITFLWNEVTWNDLTMERNDWIPLADCRSTVNQHLDDSRPTVGDLSDEVSVTCRLQGLENITLFIHKSELKRYTAHCMGNFSMYSCCRTNPTASTTKNSQSFNEISLISLSRLFVRHFEISVIDTCIRHTISARETL